MRGTCARTFLLGPRAPTLAKARRAGCPRPLGGPEGRAATCGASGAARESPEAGGEVSTAADVSSGAWRAGEEPSVWRVPRRLPQPGRPPSGGAHCSRRGRTKARGRRCRGGRGAAAGERPGLSGVGVGGAEFRAAAALSEDAPGKRRGQYVPTAPGNLCECGRGESPRRSPAGSEAGPSRFLRLAPRGRGREDDAPDSGAAASLQPPPDPCHPTPKSCPLLPISLQSRRLPALRAPQLPPRWGLGVGGFALGCDGEFIASGIKALRCK